MLEKFPHNYLIKILEKNGLPFIHIPNSAFGKHKARLKCLVDFSDVFFANGFKTYQWEIGIMVGKTVRNKDRKYRQMEKMRLWAHHGGVSIDTIYIDHKATENEAKEIIEKKLRKINIFT